jgi:drug/metabolite transporter (DMT)-like permease
MGMPALPSLHRHAGASGLGNILAAVCLWGAIPFVTNAALQGLLPGELVVLRMLAAGVLLAVMAGPRRFYAALRRHPWSFLALSLLGFALPNLMYVYALRTPVAIAVLTFVASSYPVWAIAMAVVFLRERPSAFHFAGLACAVLGLYLMSGVAPGSGAGVPPGIVLVLAASLGWATASVLGKKLTATVDGLAIAAGRHLLSGILLLPIMLVEGVRMPQANLGAWQAMLVLVAMSVLSYWLYYRGLAHTSVSSASLIEVFMPVVSWGIGAAVYGQGLNRGQVMAACLILAGTLLATVRDIRRGAAAQGVSGTAA